MWAAYLLAGIFAVLGVFILGAVYGGRVARKAYEEEQKLKQWANRVRS